MTSPSPQIRALLAAGYANGLWTGNGITSSVAADDASATGASALGYLDNAFFELPEYPPGHPIPTQCVFVSYTTYGDANFDYLVNGSIMAFSTLASAGESFLVRPLET